MLRGDPRGSRIIAALPPPTPTRRPDTWIVLTVVLGAAVIGLAIWVVVLQQDKDDQTAASAARIEELEQQNADLEQQVEDQQADAESALAEAQSALDGIREQYEGVSEELGAKGQDLAESRAELERLAEEAEAALSEAESATASAEARADSETARADRAEACLAAVADVLQRLYASEEPTDALEQAAEELETIASDCAPSD